MKTHKTYKNLPLVCFIITIIPVVFHFLVFLGALNIPDLQDGGKQMVRSLVTLSIMYAYGGLACSLMFLHGKANEDFYISGISSLVILTGMTLVTMFLNTSLQPTTPYITFALRIDIVVALICLVGVLISLSYAAKENRTADRCLVIFSGIFIFAIICCTISAIIIAYRTYPDELSLRQYFVIFNKYFLLQNVIFIVYTIFRQQISLKKIFAND